MLSYRVVVFVVVAAAIQVGMCGQQVPKEVRSRGPKCSGGFVKAPYSVMHYGLDTTVEYMEYVGCDGKRRSGSRSDEGKLFTYQAYTSYLFADNPPTLLRIEDDGALRIKLKQPAAIRITDAQSGAIVATYPSENAGESADYTVPSGMLAGVAGHLLVVDVLRLADKSLHGTKSIVYRP